MMSDTKETPTARSTIFANIHDDACELFHNGRYEESEQLCLTLLAEPDLGDYHKVSLPSIPLLCKSSFDNIH